MARWGKMTERGCYTMPPELKEKLSEMAYAKNMPESEIVRNALELYFEQSGSEGEKDVAQRRLHTAQD